MSALPLWQPQNINSTWMTHFTKRVAQSYSLQNLEYATLHQWSVEHPELFWEAVWQDCGVVSERPYLSVMQDPKMPGTKWFAGATLNFAENILHKGREDKTAIYFVREDGLRQCLTFGQLRQQVAVLGQALRAFGLGSGDRVGAVVANCTESIVAALACASIGAIWSSCSPDFGVNGIEDRLGQIKPKVLFAVDGYLYNGKSFEIMDKLEKIVAKIPSLEKVVIIPFIGCAGRDNPLFVTWEQFTQNAKSTEEFTQLPFDHPLYILYSSGTTGIPKSIVHGAGGTFLQHRKEHRYHTDLHADDCLFFFTTCGWMMWNWTLTALAEGSSIVLYDGSPLTHDVGQLFRLIDDIGITHFGINPKLLSLVQQQGYLPAQQLHLASLRCLLCTGSPLPQEMFAWIYQNIKQDLHLASISGGTDLISCFVLGNPNLPVYAGEIQCKGLGMDVHAYNEQAQSVVGDKGELVCATPFPSMPIYFWNDSDGKKYQKTYFDQYKGIWTHGDFIQFNERGGAIIHGRSDTTLNPGGVRIGTAEIYRQIENLPEIVDSLVIGQHWQNDVRVILFVVLKSSFMMDESLVTKIKKSIREGASPRHVPQLIYSVTDIPRTLNGKKVEKAVTQIFAGEAVLNTSAMGNPQVLDEYRKLAQQSQQQQ